MDLACGSVVTSQDVSVTPSTLLSFVFPPGQQAPLIRSLWAPHPQPSQTELHPYQPHCSAAPVPSSEAKNLAGS